MFGNTIKWEIKIDIEYILTYILFSLYLVDCKIKTPLFPVLVERAVEPHIDFVLL